MGHAEEIKLLNIASDKSVINANNVKMDTTTAIFVRLVYLNLLTAKPIIEIIHMNA